MGICIGSVMPDLCCWKRKSFIAAALLVVFAAKAMSAF